MDGTKTIVLVYFRRRISFCLLYLPAFLLALSTGLAFGNPPDSAGVAETAQVPILLQRYASDRHLRNVLAPTSATPAFYVPMKSFAFSLYLLLAISLGVCIYLIAQIRKGRMRLQRAIEVNRLKSRFYEELSHEFRPPLTLILGPIEEMINRTESLQMQQCLMPIRKNAARLLELVNQLVELSKMETEKLTHLDLVRERSVENGAVLGSSTNSSAESREQSGEAEFHRRMMKPNEIAAHSVDEQFLKRMMLILEDHVGDDRFTTEELSQEMGMSRSHLHRKLKSLVGQGPNQFIRSFRLDRAHEMLRRNSGTAAEIAYAVGFGSPSYFTKCFHEKFGYTPSKIINP